MYNSTHLCFVDKKLDLGENPMGNRRETFIACLLACSMRVVIIMKTMFVFIDIAWFYACLCQFNFTFMC